MMTTTFVLLCLYNLSLLLIYFNTRFQNFNFPPILVISFKYRISGPFPFSTKFVVFFPESTWPFYLKYNLSNTIYSSETIMIRLRSVKISGHKSACNAMIMCGSFWFSCFQRLYFIWSLRVHVEEYSRNTLYVLNYISTITTHLPYMNWTLKFQIIKC